MNIKANLKVFFTPQPIMEESSFLFYSQLDKIKKYLDDNLFQEISQLNVIILFNYDLKKTIKGNPIFNEGKSSLWVVGLSDNEKSKNVSIQKSTLIAHLNAILKHYKDSILVEKFDIILLYDTDIEKLKLTSQIPASEPNSSDNDDLSFFYPQLPKYSLDKVILNSDLLNDIESALLILENKNLIYEEWGFNEIEPEPKAILNFHGPSGTGKTMTAHAIAQRLGLKILSLNYADIESKYVGVAPKNLVKAFEVAKNQKSLLFLDEADSFLGKRISNVTSNADQSVNSLRSQMLILLENFNGLVILATNLKENYDKAFESRILKHLYFPLPNPETRGKIISVSIPKRMPYQDGISFTADQINRLIEISNGFSGRHIKNAVLIAMTNAIQNNRKYIIFDDFERAFMFTAKSIQDFNATPENTKLDAETKKVLEEKISEHFEGNSISPNIEKAANNASMTTTS